MSTYIHTYIIMCVYYTLIIVLLSPCTVHTCRKMLLRKRCCQWLPLHWQICSLLLMKTHTKIPSPVSSGELTTDSPCIITLTPSLICGLLFCGEIILTVLVFLCPSLSHTHIQACCVYSSHPSTHTLTTGTPPHTSHKNWLPIPRVPC